LTWDEETKRFVYEKNNGYCRYCDKKLSWINYGLIGARGAWEIDHSVPKALGGTDYFRNLWPACIDCNRDKGISTGKNYRRTTQNSDDEDISPIIPAAIALGALAFLGWLFTQSNQNSRQY
jgi:5-methylcytosine-specific restriction endonuclease McrA